MLVGLNDKAACQSERQKVAYAEGDAVQLRGRAGNRTRRLSRDVMNDESYPLATGRCPR